MCRRIPYPPRSDSHAMLASSQPQPQSADSGPLLLHLMRNTRETLGELELLFCRHEAVLRDIKPKRFATDLQVTRTCMQWVCERMNELRLPPIPQSTQDQLMSIYTMYDKMARIEEALCTTGVVPEQHLHELAAAIDQYRVHN